MPTLDWLNRDEAFRLAQATPTRVLRPHAVGAAFGSAAVGDAAPGNWLIQGDNLDALKALLPFYRGQVKCIFIDPPYNTRSAFEHYDDNLEHAQWLTMMLPRLQLLRELLREDGSIWVTIDDNEGHYLKVLMDEVFGRGNFVANALWQKVYSERMDAVGFSADHDHLMCYQRSSRFTVGRVSKAQNVRQFNLTDARSGKPYRRRSLRKEGSESLRTDRPSMWYSISAPDGTPVLPIKPDGTEGRWRWMKSTLDEQRAGLEFVQVRNGWEIYVRQFLDDDATRPPSTMWMSEDVGHNHEAKLEAQSFDRGATFSTPKPERLIQRILQIATNPNDLVLDSFLGSGTTAAVAHKMGRRWIGIESGEHCITHCLPRLNKVIAGEQGGISQAVNWAGGGGFRLLQLGAPLFDADGAINTEVRFADLAAFIWMRETGAALDATAPASGLPLLGVHAPAVATSATTPNPAPSPTPGTAYYLLFNGILGDKRPAGGNVLTGAVVEALRASCWFEGPKVIYGEACRLGDARLAELGISFKQLPHAVPR